MSVTILITGFGPFPGAPFNPTTALAPALARLRRPALAGMRRVAHVFATSYAAVDRELPALLARNRPDVVLMFGLAARTPYLRIETRARNARSRLLPDASGRLASRGAIAADADPSRRGRAPFALLLGAARAAGVPVRLSRDAGRYLCNYVYWCALEATGDSTLVVFVHVPKIRRGPRRPASRPSLTPADLLRAGEAILSALAAAARRR